VGFLNVRSYFLAGQNQQTIPLYASQKRRHDRYHCGPSQGDSAKHSPDRFSL
jgi:hypothetical protein